MTLSFLFSFDLSPRYSRYLRNILVFISVGRCLLHTSYNWFDITYLTSLWGAYNKPHKADLTELAPYQTTVSCLLQTSHNWYDITYLTNVLKITNLGNTADLTLLASSNYEVIITKPTHLIWHILTHLIPLRNVCSWDHRSSCST